MCLAHISSSSSFWNVREIDLIGEITENIDYKYFSYGQSSVLTRYREEQEKLI